MRTDLVLDTIEQAIWTRRASGVTDLAGLVAPQRRRRNTPRSPSPTGSPTPGSTPPSARSATRFDNALAESMIGLFKTELIRRHGPWRTVDHVEIATLDWVDWFNHRRLLEVNGDLPPVELEQAYYRQHTGLTEAGLSTNRVSGHAGAFSQPQFAGVAGQLAAGRAVRRGRSNSGPHLD